MSTEIPFDRDFSPTYGVMEPVSPLIRRIVAHNPGPFTFTGTGTYIVGHGQVAVIDPGPLLPDHVEALLNALSGERISHILITHTHADHSPAARPLQDATGAPICGFGPHGGGPQDEAVEEAADREMVPDERLRDGDVVSGADWTLQAVHTPGHTSNHLCFALGQEKALFTGDHVMGWSTSVISPPDGDMAAYMQSLERLLARDDVIYWPTHGPPIRNPHPFVQAYIDHRRAREAEILEAVRRGLTTITDMVDAIYQDIPDVLRPAAARSVLAHLIDMTARGIVRAEGGALLGARYFAVD